MYVIVEINGQQFKAEEGKKLFVHHMVFHKKRRKGYRKLNGHRQQFTELTIKQVIA